MPSNDFTAILLSERKKLLETLRQTEFTRLDPALTHRQVIPLASYSPWYDDADFMNIYEEIKSNTLVDIYRCYELWKSVKSVEGLDGDVVEVGVWRGGTGALICKACETEENTKVYLADTFEGVVKAGAHDTIYKGGEHADTTEEEVLGLLSRLSIKNFQVIKGIFPDALPANIQLNDIKLCHIDVDTFESAKDIFEYAWPRLVVGGIIIFDDYGFWGCEGVTHYVNSLKLPHSHIVHNLNGHALIIKTGSATK